MTTNKLAPAQEWRNRPIETWNVSTFHAYLADIHTEMFGCDYAPFPNWIAEKSAIGLMIGTGGNNPKPRTASNEDVKAFIDMTFGEYAPTKIHPGTSFGFMRKYKQVEWQRVQIESKAKARREEAVAETDIDELADWFAE